MRCAGFVLAGGSSRRMGRDKALLAWEGSSLVQFVAGKVLSATGSATLIGNSEILDGLGYPVVADTHPASGPMGGLETALGLGLSSWNLVTACDMPGLSVESLLLLADAANSTPENLGCVVPCIHERWHPLCAIYHVSCLPLVEQAIAEKRFRMLDLLAKLNPVPVYLEASVLANVNTPAEWDAVRGMVL